MDKPSWAEDMKARLRMAAGFKDVASVPPASILWTPERQPLQLLGSHVVLQAGTFGSPLKSMLQVAKATLCAYCSGARMQPRREEQVICKPQHAKCRK